VQVAVRTAVSAIPIRTAGAAMIIKSLGVRRGHSVCVAVAQCASRSLSVRRGHSVCVAFTRCASESLGLSLVQCVLHFVNNMMRKPSFPPKSLRRSHHHSPSLPYGSQWRWASPPSSLPIVSPRLAGAKGHTCRALVDYAKCAAKLPPPPPN